MERPLAPQTAAFGALQCETATLDNGLRVIAHRDSKCPIVAVHVYYDAGSAHEPADKSGLAHIFEHLMFCGTPGHPQNYFAEIEPLGAGAINAKTYEDYTAYFAAVPISALDQALRMEARRMSQADDALSIKNFDCQREVVRNELYEREALPGGRLARVISQKAHPPGHPYTRHPNGSAEELERIGLDDIRRWRRERIGPRHALITVAGAIEPAAAIARVEYFFRDLADDPASVPSSPDSPLPPRPSATERACFVEHSRSGPGIQMVWTVAEWHDSRQIAALNLLAMILGGGPAARLFKRLVSKDGLGAAIGASLAPRALGSQLAFWVTLREEAMRARAEAAIRAEICRLRVDPPASAELALAKERYCDRSMRALERVAGPGGQADLLAIKAMAHGLAGAGVNRLEEIVSVSSDEVRMAANRWLTEQGAFTLHVIS